jgi:putative mRNA 3-end processing factor
MFHYDRGLKLTRIDLAVDVRRRQPRGFISHAHTDHMARHELAVCTPATGRLYQARYGARPVRDLPYRESLDWDGTRLTTLPAGHVFGSAMLYVEEEGRTLLYTGDFKLGPSATAEPCELPRADVLVMETTFGDPRYRLPPRDEVVGQLIELVRQTLEEGRTPVVHAYVLGKAQEVTRILTDAGFGVLQHSAVHAISQIYEACGCRLGDCSLYEGRPRNGQVVVAPPRSQRAAELRGLDRKVSIAVTGWAVDPSARHRLGVDHALPLSDHADYDQLWEAVERVAPKAVYCTHGPESFVDRLQKAGWQAYALGKSQQLRLSF